MKKIHNFQWWTKSNTPKSVLIHVTIKDNKGENNYENSDIRTRDQDPTEDTTIGYADVKARHSNLEVEFTVDNCV